MVELLRPAPLCSLVSSNAPCRHSTAYFTPEVTALAHHVCCISVRYFLRCMHSCLPHGVFSLLYLSGVISPFLLPPACMGSAAQERWGFLSVWGLPYLSMPHFYPAYTGASGEESHLQPSAIANGLLQRTIFRLVFFHHLPTIRERRAAL